MAVGDPFVGEKVIDGQYGEVYRDGIWMADVVEISGTISIDRKDIPLAGTTSNHYKRGKTSREGTLRVHHIDSRWLEEFLDFSSKTLSERRAARDAGTPLSSRFNLLLSLDDPESFGAEQLMLYGIVLWEMPVGFSIEDLVDREFPFTWEREELVEGVQQPSN